MFEKLMHKLKMLAAERRPFDPSRFGDPVAMQTAWTPARNGGTNIRTHVLVKTGADRMVFRASLGAMIFYLIFLVIGLGILYAFFYQFRTSEKFESVMLWLLLVGLVFTCIGGYLLYSGTMPIVFEKSRGVFRKGWKNREGVSAGSEDGRFVRLDNVHALQLISEYCSGSKNSYYSYELNLVLKTGKRVNVIDHGNGNKIREDAETLAEFLGKPLWDAL